MQFDAFWHVLLRVVTLGVAGDENWALGVWKRNKKFVEVFLNE